MGAASTFNGLAVQADDGILIETRVTTTDGGLYLDGDLDDSDVGDQFNTVKYSSTAGLVMIAKDVLTLESSTTGFANLDCSLTLA